MKKRLISLALALMLALSATAFAEAANNAYTERFDTLGITLAISPAWIDAATDGKVGIWQRGADAETPAGVTGYLTLYIPYDRDASPDADAYSSDQGLETWFNKTHCQLIGVVTYRAAETDAAALDALYPGLTRVSLGEAGEYSFAFYRNDATADSALPEEDKALAKLIAESYQSPAEMISVREPVSNRTELGDFTAETLDGETVTPEIFTQSKLTIVNIWATYCGPCLSEMPDMAELAKEYADKGVRFIGVVSDAIDEDTIEAARAVIKDTGADYTHLLPDAYISWVEYVPTTIFVDETGAQIGESVIGDMTREEWIEKIDKCLAKNA